MGWLRCTGLSDRPTSIQLKSVRHKDDLIYEAGKPAIWMEKRQAYPF